MESPANRKRTGRKSGSIRAVGVNIVMDAGRTCVKVCCTDGTAWLDAHDLRELAERMELRAAALKS